MDKEAVAEKTAEVVVDTLETVEETAATLERIPKLALNGTTRKQQIIILSATALAGALAGGGVTYLVTKKRLRAYYDDIAQREIAEARADYARRKPPLEDVAEERLGERVQDLNYVSAHPALEPVIDDGTPEAKMLIEQGERLAKRLDASDEEVVNVFSAHGDFTWDQAQEESKRKSQPQEAYVISLEEYMQNQPEHEQDLLTYFEGDDTLVDAKDQPVPDPDGTVGEGSLTRFGHGTTEAHVVHVRNERLDMDFEIHRSLGTYTVEVLGLPDEEEIRHSGRRGGRPRRSRERDE